MSDEEVILLPPERRFNKFLTAAGRLMGKGPDKVFTIPFGVPMPCGCTTRTSDDRHPLRRAIRQADGTLLHEQCGKALAPWTESNIPASAVKTG